MNISNWRLEKKYPTKQMDHKSEFEKTSIGVVLWMGHNRPSRAFEWLIIDCLETRPTNPIFVFFILALSNFEKKKSTWFDIIWVLGKGFDIKQAWFNDRISKSNLFCTSSSFRIYMCDQLMWCYSIGPINLIVKLDWRDSNLPRYTTIDI